MKEIWLKKESCTGCGACENICPKQAIKMQEDTSGFVYPNINLNCIDCNLCEIICKKRLNTVKTHKVQNVYGGWSKDSINRYESTSGGAFSEFAKYVLDSGGYVVGAQYNKENMVEHVLISKEEELSKIKQSKYIQSVIGNLYIETKQKLDSGFLVVFCGTPCQIAGLHAYLGKYYDNLISIDFICRGMNSPKAYRAWLDEIENTEKCKITKVWFKYKSDGWKKSPKTTRVEFSDGSYKVYKQDENTFMTGYLGPNLYIRPSCGNCSFKGSHRVSDITLADFWGIEKNFDDDKGASLILVNSKKGKNYFNLVKDHMIYKEYTLEDISKGNICFSGSVKIPKKSKKFLESLDYLSFSGALNKYGKVSIYQTLKRQIKSILKKILIG